MALKKQIVPLFVPVLNHRMRYSNPKIFIPKAKNKKGQLKPTIAVGKYWYVKYSYRNPETGLMEMFRIKEGIIF